MAADQPPRNSPVSLQNSRLEKMSAVGSSVIVKIEQVIKQYQLGKTSVSALKGVDLVVARGEFLAIAGPSGSGKTTLLNLIGCIEKPTSGRVILDGLDVDGLPRDTLADLRASKIGFIFQSFNLLPVLTAQENVEYPLLIKKIPARERRGRAQQALEDVGLSSFAHHKPLELSGGQQQRVAVARAIVGVPTIILADEPTANLDHETGLGILNLMLQISQKRQTTFIFSTHDSKIMEMATRIIRLWDGTIVSNG